MISSGNLSTNKWEYRIANLTPVAGKTISQVRLFADGSSTPGQWDIYFQDLVYTAADGTVIPLYSQNPTVPPLYAFGSMGMTQTSATINNCVGSGCAPINTTTYYHGDQIGSSRLLTNGTGYPVWQGTFLAFGEEYNAQLTTNHYKFTGKERDAESGLDYFGARYYSNELGRFISADWSATPVPVPYADFSDPQSLNQYSYVRNIPTTRTDPDGHCTVDGEKHNLAWCIGHLFGFNETNKERTDRVERERTFILTHAFHENGKPLTPAERYRIEHMTPMQVDSTYQALTSQGIYNSSALPPIQTSYGWSGSEPYRDAVKELEKPGTHETLGGKVPTRDEATRMIEESGGKVIRQDAAHGPESVSSHDYPHINYETASGIKATVKVQE